MAQREATEAVKIKAAGRLASFPNLEKLGLHCNFRHGHCSLDSPPPGRAQLHTILRL